MTDLRLGFEGPRARARTMLHEGEVAFVALGWSSIRCPRSYEEAEAWLARTGRFWQEWLKHGTFPDHPWRSHLQRSALTLKGLTYAPSGAMIAAPTTSLPETPGGDRNWDYRYSWIRDSTFMLWALYTLGFDEEANDFFYFVADVVEAEEGRSSRSCTASAGRASSRSRSSTTSPATTGARPVRIGNGAYNQDQHDVWGAVLDSIYLHTRSRDQLPDRLWPIIKRQVRRRSGALARARPRDLGGPRRAEALHLVEADVLGGCRPRCATCPDPRRRRDWRLAGRQPRTRSTPTSARTGSTTGGCSCSTTTPTALDASLLLMPLVRFLPPDDERIRATVLAIADELTEEGLVLRYRVDETDDGFSGEEGTFTICSFWLVSALVEIGELARARGLCEKLLSYASPLALYAEQIDPITGRHLGNFPQAFTHLALINAVVHIITAERRLELRALAPRAGSGSSRENSLTCDSSRLPHAASVRVAGAARVAQTDIRAEGQRYPVQTVKPPERNSAGTAVQRLRGAHEAELFGPRGRLPRRGEPDTSHSTALLILGRTHPRGSGAAPGRAARDLAR